MKLREGETVQVGDGISTTPFPRVDTTTNRRSVNTIKRVHAWLVENALQLAFHKKDKWNVFLFQNLDSKKLSQADVDSLNVYLFGEIY